MTTAIWKFPLEVTDEQTITMPTGAEVLTVQTQNEQPCLWALVRDDAGFPTEQRKFFTYGTGHRVVSDLDDYIGTYQLSDGRLVFHVFEAKR